MNGRIGWLAAGGLAGVLALAAETALAQRAATGRLEWHVVPAISDVNRLPDVFPSDGVPGGEIRIVAAQDEYESASFVVRSVRALEAVAWKVTALRGPDRSVFPADRLDLKVVKVWYQNGNAWHSPYADPGLTLVPELLLKDEKLIRVDTQRQANYARVDEPGASRYVWISAPPGLDPGFDPFAVPFADAETLQPVRLPAGEFKQFWLTVHVPKGARPGVYRGTLEAGSSGGVLATIPLAVRVLPFELPSPRTAFDPDREFVVTLMGAWPPLEPGHPAVLPILHNLRRHNILHLGPEAGPDTPEADAARRVALMKEAGFVDRPILSGRLTAGVDRQDGAPLTFDELMAIWREAGQWTRFYMTHFGHTDAAIRLDDKPTAGWDGHARPAWRILHEMGLRSSLAGHGRYPVKGAHMLDVYQAATGPADEATTRPWNAAGHAAVAAYANPPTGVENPAYVRRQHGLLGYLANYSMVNNREFAYGPWNDRAPGAFKPLVLAYPTSRGLVDTLAWEGFREGIDDIRYATLLKLLARHALGSRSLDRIYAGRKALAWLAMLDGETADLNAVRLEMIDKILALLEAAGQEGGTP